MIKRTIAIVAVLAGTVVAIGHNSVERLEQATARQCLMQDWPVHQHQDHLDFCREYGYEVGPAN